jgi:uncharacterized protein (TIGR02452 family)
MYLKKIYEENEEICDDEDIPESKFVNHYSVFRMLEKPYDLKMVDFFDGKTNEAAQYAYACDYDNIVIMNFANNRHPGGGYIRGASAQEEDCCRYFPTLYRSLVNAKKRDYKTKQIVSAYKFDKRDVIVTPNVKLMRSTPKYSMLNDEAMFNVNFVSASAPDMAHEKFDLERVDTALRTTLLAPIKTLRINNPKKNCIIMGAWGCGAFGNDSFVMAECMSEAVEKYGGYYDKVIMAIPDRSDGNYEEFKLMFGKKN